MSRFTINHVAFGSALLLHGLVLSLAGWSRGTLSEPEEHITIRFTSAAERVMPAPQVAAVETPVVEPSPPIKQLHKVAPLRTPAQQPAQAVPVAAPKAVMPQRPLEPSPAVAQQPQTAPREAAVPVQRAPHGMAAAPIVPQLKPGGAGARPLEGKVAAAAAEPSPRLAAYLAQVRGMVEANREYPAMARQLGVQGTVMVRVSIRSDGSIGEVNIASSAGNKSLDKAAVSAVRRAAPFKSPGGFGLGEVTVEIPIVYRLT